MGFTHLSGVYRPIKDGKSLYGHCNKIMGYGVEKGTPYFLAMNTWGREFGEHGRIMFVFLIHNISINSSKLKNVCSTM